MPLRVADRAVLLAVRQVGAVDQPLQQVLRLARRQGTTENHLVALRQETLFAAARRPEPCRLGMAVLRDGLRPYMLVTRAFR